MHTYSWLDIALKYLQSVSRTLQQIPSVKSPQVPQLDKETFLLKRDQKNTTSIHFGKNKDTRTRPTFDLAFQIYKMVTLAVLLHVFHI